MSEEGKKYLILHNENNNKTVVYSHEMQEEANYNLAYFIAKKGYPLSFCDNSEFRKYVNSFQPQAKVPCRNTIQKIIKERIYPETEKIVNNYLFNSNSS